jgi:hypothetical protein
VGRILRQSPDQAVAVPVTLAKRNRLCRTFGAGRHARAMLRVRVNDLDAATYRGGGGRVASRSQASTTHPVTPRGPANADLVNADRPLALYNPTLLPQRWVGRVTPGQAVDSSAIVTMPGTRR